MLKEWFGGPIIHVHTRLEDKSASYQPGEEIQFTLLGLQEYARKFSGDPKITVVDTDHAALGIHPDWASDKKQEYFFPQNTQTTTRQISENVAKRADDIKRNESMQILTGTEADILDSSGTLDISNEVLSKLDLVIASFHYFPWAATNFAGGEKRHIGIREILMAYERAVTNPNVDVLGHPTAYIQKYNRDESLIVDWEPLFRMMAETGTAFEINLSKLLDLNNQREFDLRVISTAAKNGVNFIVGLDLHNLKAFGSSLGPDFIIDEKTVDTALAHNKGGVNTAFFYSLKSLIRELKAGGLSQDIIINNNNDKFWRWLKSQK